MLSLSASLSLSLSLQSRSAHCPARTRVLSITSSVYLSHCYRRLLFFALLQSRYSEPYKFNDFYIYWLWTIPHTCTRTRTHPFTHSHTNSLRLIKMFDCNRMIRTIFFFLVRFNSKWNDYGAYRMANEFQNVMRFFTLSFQWLVSRSRFGRSRCTFSEWICSVAGQFCRFDRQMQMHDALAIESVMNRTMFRI